MIIWDYKKKEHYIRIAGQEKARIKKVDFPLSTSNKDNEDVIKLSKDLALGKWHIYIHIFSKPTSLSPMDKLNYILWLGVVGTEPIALLGNTYWWG